MKEQKVIIVGGGAAGFFAAIRCKQLNPNLDVHILERGKQVLQKVKVSGGGRCNVTHACYIPKDLVKFYPRGQKELLGPFHRFCSGDMLNWLDQQGVETKVEDDGRIFPASNSSQTIIDCFWKNVKQLGIQVHTGQQVAAIRAPSGEQAQYQVITAAGKKWLADKLLMATGSNPRIWKLLGGLGHAIIEPVPSLFTFNIKDSRIQNLAGLSVPNAKIQVVGRKKLVAQGPLLITHWGMSGPGILRLSAWGARTLNEANYEFKVLVNWNASLTFDKAQAELRNFKQLNPKQQIAKHRKFDLPNRLWQSLVAACNIPDNLIWAEMNKKQLNALAIQLTQATFEVKGKSTFKEEFVTAGGVKLKEIDFTRFESKLHPNLFMAGEVLNIDAITGGFNFQAAWTGAYLAAEAIASEK
ncbi:MAG: NAD(P)/FAD-dependent oxidoreductase [Aureispira sp.]|nr:NAD(P)/FAD-dependent oxidoreductase [Aureispira sp.]